MKVTTWIAAGVMAAVLVSSHVVNCLSAEACRKVAAWPQRKPAAAQQQAATSATSTKPMIGQKMMRDEAMDATMAADQTPAMTAPAMKMEQQPLNIVQTAVGPGMQTVTTLVKAVQAAELVDALQQPGPFTVFAPTNDAFAKLPSGTIDELLKPENKAKLQAILLYHVHGGEAIPAANLRPGKLSTLNGKAVEIRIDGPTVMVDSATVTKSDVTASNGVIHWLDTVILPE